MYKFEYLRHILFCIVIVHHAGDSLQHLKLLKLDDNIYIFIRPNKLRTSNFWFLLGTFR
jgi:hypothetical protein